MTHRLPTHYRDSDSTAPCPHSGDPATPEGTCPFGCEGALPPTYETPATPGRIVVEYAAWTWVADEALGRHMHALAAATENLPPLSPPPYPPPFPPQPPLWWVQRINPCGWGDQRVEAVLSGLVSETTYEPEDIPRVAEWWATALDLSDIGEQVPGQRTFRRGPERPGEAGIEVWYNNPDHDVSEAGL